MRNKLFLALTVCMVAAALIGCSPKDTDTMMKAQSALDEGDLENAVALYDAAIEEGRQLQACYRGKGIALMKKMEYKSAEEAFIKALDSATFIEEKIYRDGMADDIRRYLASCYIHSEEPEKAILIYDALIDKNDENALLFMERGTAKAASGDLDSAKPDFDKAINMRRKEDRQRVSGRRDLFRRQYGPCPEGKDPLFSGGLQRRCGTAFSLCGTG